MEYENQALEDFSLKLYDYLSNYIVGSEKAVRYRQIYFKVYDEYSDRSDISLISSGSKAEGLDLPGSDLDVMVLFKDFKVYAKGIKQNEIFMDTDDANPGFTLLKVMDKKHTSLPSQIYTNSFIENCHVISNMDFMTKCIRERFKHFYTDVQGPSVPDTFLDIDRVPCLQCNTWPAKAGEWLRRIRNSKWPSADLIENITYHGVLVVPVGSKFYSAKGDIFEWRLSFSLAEKTLVYSFNNTQILCYSLLKIFLKEIINKDINLTKLLCSYYIKTLMFWMLEEVNQESWIPEKFTFWFLSCIKRLQYWIMIDYIPNYFIPEHNLIDGKFSIESRRRLLTIFDELLVAKNWDFLLSASSLQRFRMHNYNDAALTKKDRNIYANVYTLLNKIPCKLVNTRTIPDIKTVAYRTFNKIKNTCLSKLERNFCALQFIQDIFSIEKKISIHCNSLNNTIRYRNYNIHLPCILISTYGDAICGWFILAMFYYTNQEYNKMLQVLHVISDILSFDLLHISVDSRLTFSDITLRKFYCTCKTFLKRIRHEVMISNVLCNNGLLLEKKYYHRDICVGVDGPVLFFSCPPVVIFHYLSFLHQFKTNNNIQSALYRLKLSVENLPLDCISNYAALMLLMKAYNLYPVPYKHRDLLESLSKMRQGISSTEMQRCVDILNSFRTSNPFVWRRLKDETSSFLKSVFK